ncbi:MAG TPA: ankyrin repeat domain-containing protein [Pyrinomonadaceae bacterium]|nr:ankyrin repeat domain-containing protein [Pyrinomonadaceae bacterium]
MKAILLTLSLLLAATPVLAQDAKQQLNDQMYEAVRRGDVAAVTALLDKGADVNAKFRYGATALFKAAERGNAPIVKLLLARGADATVKDTFYNAKAMTWALGENINVELVSALLEKDPTSVEDVLITGVDKGNVALVEVALAQGGAKPETLTVALAASLGDKDKAAIAESLKKAGAKPPLEVDAATLQSYVGQYKPETGAEIAFSLKDGRLFLKPPSNPVPFALMALDKTTFRPVAFGGLVVTFTVEGEKTSGLTLKQGTTTTVYKKVEETKQ